MGLQNQVVTTAEAREYAENIVDTVREPLVVLDGDLRVISVSPSFYQVFMVTPEETQGRLIYDLGNQQWDIPELRELLHDILPEKNVVDDFEMEHDFETIGRMTILLNVRRLYREAKETPLILLAIEDITERKEKEEQLKKYSEEQQERTEKLRTMINCMAGREARMVELKKIIKKLRTQLKSAGLTPVADDPLKEMARGKR